MRVAWHETQGDARAGTRAIPDAANSIVVTLFQQGTVVARTQPPIVRPQASYSFPGIPADRTRVEAAAFVSQDGTGSPIATGVLPGVDVSPGLPTIAPPLVLNRVSVGGSISGRVTDPSGTPLAEVSVETSDGVDAWRARTSADGRYQIDNVPAGLRVLSFSTARRTTTFEVTVTQGSQVTLDAVLQPFTGTIASRPVINLDEPTVDQNTGQATISGTISELDSDRAIVIANGGETLVHVGQDGRFSSVVILATGSNSIRIRATNALGTTLSDEQVIPYTPASLDFFFRVTLTWDGPGDIDLHTWDPSGNHSFFLDKSIETGELDRDNTERDGPENFTCRQLTPGRYRIGVNAYSIDEPRNAVIRVTINSGPRAGRTYAFGPYTLPQSNHNSDYPVTRNTESWWRPLDVTVSSNGSIAVAPADVSVSLDRGRAIQGRSLKK